MKTTIHQIQQIRDDMCPHFVKVFVSSEAVMNLPQRLSFREEKVSDEQHALKQALFDAAQGGHISLVYIVESSRCDETPNVVENIFGSAC